MKAGRIGAVDAQPTLAPNVARERSGHDLENFKTAPPTQEVPNLVFTPHLRASVHPHPHHAPALLSSPAPRAPYHTIFVWQFAPHHTAVRRAYKLGDCQVDQLIELSRLTVRQRRAMWRAFCLLQRGRYDDAIATLEAECLELHDRGAAR